MILPSLVTIWGQTIIRNNGELAASLLFLLEKSGKSCSFTFSDIAHNWKSWKCTDAAGARPVSNPQDVTAFAQRALADLYAIAYMRYKSKLSGFMYYIL